MAYGSVSLTEGSGPKASKTDVIGGVHVQVMKAVHGAEGELIAQTPETPAPVAVYGELVEAIQALRMTLAGLSGTLGAMSPDVIGRLRVLAENPTAANLLVTASIAASQTLGTVSTVGNQTNMGGFAANDQIPALMNAAADSLRRNIVVT